MVAIKPLRVVFAEDSFLVRAGTAGLPAEIDDLYSELVCVAW